MRPSVVDVGSCQSSGDGRGRCFGDVSRWRWRWKRRVRWVPMTRAEEAALGVQEPLGDPHELVMYLNDFKIFGKLHLSDNFEQKVWNYIFGWECHPRIWFCSHVPALLSQISFSATWHALGASVEPLLHHIVSCLGFLFLGANSGEASTEDMRRRSSDSEEGSQKSNCATKCSDL